MTAPISEVKRKVAGKVSQPLANTSSIILNDKDKEYYDILNLNKNKFKNTNPKTESPDLYRGRELIYKSIRMRKNQSKEQVFKKSENLKLGDYLRLTSLSKRAQASRSVSKAKSDQPKLLKQETPMTRSKNAIDTYTSIKVVREQTKKQLLLVHKKLSKFLKKLQVSQHLRQDDESLVFMCNVLHIFEDKIMQSVKYAQQLIQERKKQKNMSDEKQLNKNNYNGLRRFRNKSKLTGSSLMSLPRYTDSLSLKQ